MIAYFDCFSGISGDMTLGAMIDLGVPGDYLVDHLQKLGLEELSFKVQDVKKNGISAKSVFITSVNDRIHRDYHEIKKMISESHLSSGVKKRSLDIFEKIARAEAAIHDQDPDHVHFHEVGGLDSIADIIGTALCLEYLNIDTVVSSHIPLGHGFVTCSHGKIPVPAPATLKILEGIPVYDSGVAMEIVTPTGAAIVSSVASEFGGIPPMTIRKTGYGAGKKEIDERPNLLRVVLGEPQQVLVEDHVYEISASIDDMNPEIYSYLMDQLFLMGALDVNFIPVHMKKNRPAVKLEIVCYEGQFPEIKKCIFKETSTLGIRFQKQKRLVLKRKTVLVSTSFGEVKAKQVTGIDGKIKMIPEYEECRKIAMKYGKVLKDVYDILIAEFIRQ